jgi:hypothetical protein
VAIVTEQTRKDLEYALTVVPRIKQIYIDGETGDVNKSSEVIFIFDKNSSTFERDCKNDIIFREYLYNKYDMWDLEGTGTRVYGIGGDSPFFKKDNFNCVFDDSKGGWL